MKKGFTLIELLAVIIILAVVSLIATPMVLDVVEDARDSVNTTTAYNIIDAGKLYYAESVFDENKANKIKSLNSIYNDINVSGKKPENGSLYVNEKGNVAAATVMDKKCYKKEFVGDLTITNDEDCTLGYVGNDSVAPTVTLTTSVTLVNEWAKENFWVNVLVEDDEAGANNFEWCISNAECDPNNGGKVVGATGDINITTERENYLCVIGYDNNGNFSEKKCEVFKLDKTAPEFTGIDDITIDKDSTIDLTTGVVASDSLSGVDGTYSYNPTTVDTSVAGTTNVIYSIADLAGNTRNVTRKIIVDAEAPFVNFSQDYAWHKNSFLAPAEVIDNSGLGIKETKWCITQGDTCEPNTNGVGTTVSPQISVESNNNRICVTATDNNNKTSQPVCSDAYKLDKTAPVAGTIKVLGTVGSSNWYTSDVSISAIDGDDSLSGHASTTVNINSITANTTGTVVTLTTTDAAGNTSSITKTIKVDKSGPTLALNNQNMSIMAGTSINTTTYFTPSYSISGGTMSCTPINTSGLAVGTRTILCTAIGGNGITSTSSIDIRVTDPEYIDGSGANRPELYANMIPVTFNGSNWVYANKTSAWYDYNSKQWANAVVLNSGVTKSVGSTIALSEIAQMYVWIPRYKYTIFNGNNGTASAQQVNITFESGTAKTGTVRCVDSINVNTTSSETCTDSTNGGIVNGRSTYTHPAFTFGDKELTGIWVGKFENSTSADNTTYTTIPNAVSTTNVSLSSHYNTIANIATKFNMTGANSHLMKSMEWGATAYFKQSKYGLGTTAMGINNNNVTVSGGLSYTSSTTGCGAALGTAKTTACNAYNTTNGKLASTTGTIYGIYDLAGGMGEITMGNAVNSSGNFNSGSAGFSTAPDAKFYDKYSYGLTDASGWKLGDATKETRTTLDATNVWESGYLMTPSSSYPWMYRGGSYSSSASLYSIVQTSNGSSWGGFASRTTLVSGASSGDGNIPTPSKTTTFTLTGSNTDPSSSFFCGDFNLVGSEIVSINTDGGRVAQMGLTNNVLHVCATDKSYYDSTGGGYYYCPSDYTISGKTCYSNQTSWEHYTETVTSSKTTCQAFGHNSGSCDSSICYCCDSPTTWNGRGNCVGSMTQSASYQSLDATYYYSYKLTVTYR